MNTMADWIGYETLCKALNLPCNGSDRIDDGNHKIMAALLARIEQLEKDNKPEEE
jgi:hypothetical protein